MKKLLFGAFLLAGVSFGFAKENSQTQNISPSVEATLKENKTVKTIRFNSEEAALDFIKRCTDVYVDIEYIGSDGEYDYYDVTVIVVEYDC